MRTSYEVTRWCNHQTQHWRGQLRGYEVTRGLCAGAREATWIGLFVHVMRDGVTA